MTEGNPNLNTSMADLDLSDNSSVSIKPNLSPNTPPPSAFNNAMMLTPNKGAYNSEVDLISTQDIDQIPGPTNPFSSLDVRVTPYKTKSVKKIKERYQNHWYFSHRIHHKYRRFWHTQTWISFHC